VTKTKNKVIEVQGFTPHKDQRRVIDVIEETDAKYFTLTTGRQWGKSWLGENLILKWALENNTNTLMWVSPVYSQAKKVFNELIVAVGDTSIVKGINRSNLEITFVNGSKILFRSGERPDTLRGYTLDYLVVDEAAFIKDEVWNTVLKQTVLVKGKKCLFISTPKGKNWFYTISLRGKDPEQSNYVSLKGTSYDTPYISNEEVEEARKTLPEDIFRQEMLGEFIDTGGEVFVNLDSYCVIDRWEEPKTGIKYYGGIDFGRQNDYTVLTILDETGKVVYIYRERQKEWSVIISEIKRLLNKYKAVTYVEVNNIGDVIYEQLKKEYRYVEPFITSNSSKQNIIEDLIYGLNERSILLPSQDLFSPLYSELTTFTYTYSPKTRRIQYSAIEGAHDDIIMSLSIGYYSLKQKRTKGQYFIR
jgi:phage terminase large subunit